MNENEWIVFYVHESGVGRGFVVDMNTGAVTDPQADQFTAARVGLLEPDAKTVLTLSELDLGLIPCSSWSAKGWCFQVKGVATNTSESVVSVDAQVDLIVKIGERVFDGEGSRSAPDRFRYTSASRPWKSGESRTFNYRSRVIPEVYAEHSGEALAVFEITTGTVARGDVRETYLVDVMSWGPDNIFK